MLGAAFFEGSFIVVVFFFICVSVMKTRERELWLYPPTLRSWLQVIDFALSCKHIYINEAIDRWNIATYMYTTIAEGFQLICKSQTCLLPVHP